MDIATMSDPETVELDEGVTVSSPDTPEQQDVTPVEDDSPSSMLEAVTEAMKEEGASSDPGTEDATGTETAEVADQEPIAEGEQQQADASPETPAEEQVPQGDPTEEEMKDYSQKANARIRDLVTQRNEASQRAQQAAPLMDFIEKNQIPGDDLNVMLDLTARLRSGDFAGFLQGVQPYVNLAAQYTGQVLPPDLQEQVDKGYVAPQIATELAQRRAQLQVSEGNAQQAQRTAQVQQTEVRAVAIRQAVDDWEATTRQTDPDFALKAEMIRRTSQALMQERGVPQTPEEAVQVVKTAYTEVTGQTKSFRPQPKPTTPSPQSTGQSGGSAPVAEPSSMMEAAMQGLQNASRG